MGNWNYEWDEYSTVPKVTHLKVSPDEFVDGITAKEVPKLIEFFEHSSTHYLYRNYEVKAYWSQERVLKIGKWFIAWSKIPFAGYYRIRTGLSKN